MDVSVLLLPMGVMFSGMILLLQQVWFSVLSDIFGLYLALTHAFEEIAQPAEILYCSPRLRCVSNSYLRLSSDDALHDASIEKVPV